MLATRITCSALRVSAVGISSLEKSCRGQPSALLQARRLADRHAAPDVLLQGSIRRDAAGGCRAKNFRQIGLRIGPSLDGVEGGGTACVFLGASTRHGFYRGVRRDVFPPPASNRRWYPFSSTGLGGNATSRRAHLLTKSLANAAPPRNSRRQASRRPSPPRAPLPRRRVRRGCAEPAPPAGPSGAAGSGQPLGTLRSPPRPRGGANRAGERVPRSCSTIARGGVAVQRKYGR